MSAGPSYLSPEHQQALRANIGNSIGFWSFVLPHNSPTDRVREWARLVADDVLAREQDDQIDRQDLEALLAGIALMEPSGDSQFRMLFMMHPREGFAVWDVMFYQPPAPGIRESCAQVGTGEFGGRLDAFEWNGVGGCTAVRYDYAANGLGGRDVVGQVLVAAPFDWPGVPRVSVEGTCVSENVVFQEIATLAFQYYVTTPQFREVVAATQQPRRGA